LGISDIALFSLSRGLGLSKIFFAYSPKFQRTRTTETCQTQMENAMTVKYGFSVRARAILAIFMAVTCQLASAQNWPSRPIRLVVANAAGGVTDVVARLVGQSLGEALGQPVVVDNKPGAGGILGTEIVAKAPPDGYTLRCSTTPIRSFPLPPRS
jgi:hypothetical protein